jgi:hypothetical protein
VLRHRLSIVVIAPWLTGWYQFDKQYTCHAENKPTHAGGMALAFPLWPRIRAHDNIKE